MIKKLLIKGLLGVGGSAAVFKPSDVSGLVMHLKADAIVGKNDGDIIAAWTDESGNNNSPAQAGADSIKPVYKTNIQNGKPAVRFDGTDDFLAKAFTLAPPYTIYIAFKVLAYSHNKTIFDGFSATNNVRAYIGTADGRFYLEGLAADGAAAFFQTGPVAGNSVIAKYTVVTGAAASSVSINGGAAATGNTGNTASAKAGFTLGKCAVGLFANFDCFEILLYNSAITGTSHTNILSYLNTKWAVF